VRLDDIAPARVHASLIYPSFMETPTWSTNNQRGSSTHLTASCFTFKVTDTYRAARLQCICASVPTIKIFIYAIERIDNISGQRAKFWIHGPQSRNSAMRAMYTSCQGQRANYFFTCAYFSTFFQHAKDIISVWIWHTLLRITNCRKHHYVQSDQFNHHGVHIYMCENWEYILL
jgi:hypothetical protein